MAKSNQCTPKYDTNDKYDMIPNRNSYPQLPEVIINIIVEYMDIPSLSNFSQTCKQTSNSLFSTVITDDVAIWGTLIQRRFNIENVEKKRPKTFGGATWKAAYGSLMYANRIPRCRLLTGKGKTVFAKPVLGSDFPVFCDTHSEHVDENKRNKMNTPGMSLWVSLGHTADCNTRNTRVRRWNALTKEEESSILSRSSSASTFDNHYKSFEGYKNNNTFHGETMRNPNYNQNDESGYQRFIELHLCIQNTKSSDGSIHVDLSEAFVQQINAAHDIINVGIKTWGKYRPKVLFYSGDSDIGYKQKTSSQNNSQKQIPHSLPFSKLGPLVIKSIKPNMKRSKSCHDRLYRNNHEGNKKPYLLTLHPFEFVIVAVNVPCTSDMIYETDFLSRSLMFHVPITADRYTQVQSQSKLKWIKQVHHCLATASFLSEMEIWDHYMQLPGGCLTLLDSRRALSV